MVQSLSVESGLALEEARGGHLLPRRRRRGRSHGGLSEASRLVVRFDATRLLDALLDLDDDANAPPRRFIVDYFERDVSDLPIDVEGVVAAESRPRFAEAMTDRIVARFGRYIRPADLSDMPVVRLERPTGEPRSSGRSRRRPPNDGSSCRWTCCRPRSAKSTSAVRSRSSDDGTYRPAPARPGADHGARQPAGVAQARRGARRDPDVPAATTEAAASANGVGPVRVARRYRDARRQAVAR